MSDDVSDGKYTGTPLQNQGKEISVAGVRKKVTDKRWNRLQKVSSLMARGLNAVEIHERLDTDVTIDAIYRDINLVTEMDQNVLRNSVLLTLVQNTLRSGREAEKRFWEISDKHADDDFEEANPFASIKAAKHAFDINKSLLDTLSKLGFDVAEFLDRRGSGPVDDIDDDILDQRLKGLLSAMNEKEIANIVEPESD